MTHTTSTTTEATALRAQHTATCYAYAVGCAVENIHSAALDAGTRAWALNADPIAEGEGYLADGLADCRCIGVSEYAAATLAAGYAAVDAADAGISGQDVTGRHVVLNDGRVFLVGGGFGALPDTIGSAVYGSVVATGEQGRVNRGDLARVATAAEVAAAEGTRYYAPEPVTH